MNRKVIFSALAALTLGFTSVAAEAHPGFGIAIGVPLPGIAIGAPVYGPPAPVYAPGPYYGAPYVDAYWGPRGWYPGWDHRWDHRWDHGYGGWHGRPDFAHGGYPGGAPRGGAPLGPQQHWTR